MEHGETLSYIEIKLNFGDADTERFNKFRDISANGAYHACRLREEIDINSSKRIGFKHQGIL